MVHGAALAWPGVDTGCLAVHGYKVGAQRVLVRQRSCNSVSTWLRLEASRSGCAQVPRGQGRITFESIIYIRRAGSPGQVTGKACADVRGEEGRLKGLKQKHQVPTCSTAGCKGNSACGLVLEVLDVL